MAFFFFQGKASKKRIKKKSVFNPRCTLEERLLLPSSCIAIILNCLDGMEREIFSVGEFGPTPSGVKSQPSH